MFKNEEIHNLNRTDIEQGKLVFSLASPKNLDIRQEKVLTNEFYVKDTKKSEMKHERNMQEYMRRVNNIVAA